MSMLADTLVGKPLRSLPADALKAPIAAVVEIETSRDLNDKLERLKRCLGQSTRSRYLVIAVRV
jgi:hypothetical protein